MTVGGLPHSEISGSACKRLPGAYRSVATSFFGSVCQGIHHMPFLASFSFSFVPSHPSSAHCFSVAHAEGCSVRRKTASSNHSQRINGCSFDRFARWLSLTSVLAKLNSHHSRCFYSHVKVLLSGGLRHSGGLRPQEPAGLAACACACAFAVG